MKHCLPDFQHLIMQHEAGRAIAQFHALVIQGQRHVIAVDQPGQRDSAHRALHFEISAHPTIERDTRPGKDAGLLQFHVHCYLPAHR